MVYPGKRGLVVILAVLVLAVSLSFSGEAKTVRGRLQREKARLMKLKREQEKAKKELERTIRIQKKLKKDVTYLKKRLQQKKRFLKRIERELEYVEKMLNMYSARVESINERKRKLERAYWEAGAELLRLKLMPVVGVLDFMERKQKAYGISFLCRELVSVGEDLKKEERLVSKKLEKLEDTRHYWEKKEKSTLTKKKEIERVRKKRERELKKLSRKRKAIERKYARLRRDIRSLQKVITGIEKKARKSRKKALRRISPKGLTYPVKGVVVSRFGRVKDRDFNVYIDNKGVEIKGRPGAKVRAVGDGVVVYQGNVSSFGLVTVIEHGGEIFSVYGKAEVYNVKVGDRVKKGQKIGSLNKKGAPVLYFELRVRGKPVNPLKYIRIPRT